MIRENQRLLNVLNVLTDGIFIFISLPLAFWIRFYMLPGGIISVPVRHYLVLALILTVTHLFSYAIFGFRQTRLLRKFAIICLAGAMNMSILMSFLYIQRSIHYSRWVLLIFSTLICFALSSKRVILRLLLRFFRRHGYNQKHIILAGASAMGQRYVRELQKDISLGYQVNGCIASRKSDDLSVPYLGGFDVFGHLLESYHPDEVICALEFGEFGLLPQIIESCEKTGTKLRIIPFYAEYMHSSRQINDFNGIPLMNIRG